MKSKFNLANELITFITEVKESDRALALKERIIVLFKLFTIVFIVSLIINALLNILYDYKYGVNDIPIIRSNFDIIVLLIVTPIHEELMFRLFLTKYKISYFIVSLSLILSFLTKLLITNYIFLGDDVNSVLTSYLFLFILFIPYFVLLTIYRKRINKLNRFWDKNFKLLFYIITILFMLIHFNISYYNNFGFLASIIKLLPIFLVGFFSGFIRINMSLLYSIIFHLSVNLPYTLFILFR